jgi:hypothetical protein
VFQDINQNPGAPELDGWTIHLFDTETKALVRSTTSQFGRYELVSTNGGFPIELGNYTVCEVLQEGWTQTAPRFDPPFGVTLADCTAYMKGGSLTLAARGYNVQLRNVQYSDLDFGNARSAGPQFGSTLRGIKFDDLNGNSVRDPGEPGIPGWDVHLIVDGIATKSQSAPQVRATIRVDRHTRRPAGGEQAGTCDPGFEGCSTTTGGRVSIVLMQGPLRAEAMFDVDVPFQLGCIHGIPKREEIFGVLGSLYIPLADYWLPPDLLASHFAKIGILVDPVAFLPVIKEVRERHCVDDPNPANRGASVRNPGILIVDAEIGFVSTANKLVAASTSANASAEYEFRFLPPGTYTVCESLPPGWRQTFPGTGSATCGGTNAKLAARGHVVTLPLLDASDVPDIDFGNVSDVRLWLGLKSSDDQGALFDVKVELLKNGGLMASGLRRCVTGLTRNPTSAQGVRVAWDKFNPASLGPADALALKVSDADRTNPMTPNAPRSGIRRCGLRLYYDATGRPSTSNPPHIESGVTLTRRHGLSSRGARVPMSRTES